MVHLSLDTPYMKLFADFLAKKHRLAVDAWGADDTHVQETYKPLQDLIKKEIPEQYQHLCVLSSVPPFLLPYSQLVLRYPAPIWRLESRITRISRNILVAEFLVAEWADHFQGKSDAEIDEIAASFKFEHCLKREGLNKVLTDHAQD